MRVRRVEERDRAWIRETAAREWGSERMVSRGRLTEDVAALDGFVAERDGRPTGLALVRRDEDGLEVVALAATERGVGVGTALVRAVEEEAARLGCGAWLVTTNDNVDALRFYQRRGWAWTAFRRDALAESRRLKPEIPEVGEHGIPLLHELELRWPSA